MTNSTSRAKKGIEHFTSTPSLSQQPSSLPVAEIAKQVTVRILTEPGSGSGVIIERQGQTYTVLTCDHVVADSQGDQYTVLTADGMTQPARRKSISHLGDTDLALVQFESKKLYRVAALGDSNALSAGERVYASGFPNYKFLSQNNVEDTRDWGTRAFRLTTGEASLLLDRSLPEGYRLGYTNEVEQGMSGGPVLNESGQVVGINGRLKYPLQGIDVFTFADGTKPSEELFQQMEALSWAIPITTFRSIAEQNLTQLHHPNP
jgi:S1-C subfamily serine protease